MQDFEVIVLAAGKSTRINSEIPKVLHKIFGKPVLGYTLDLLSAIKIKRIALVVGYRQDLVKEFIKAYKNKLDIRLCRQKRLLGTADAIKPTRNLFKKAKADVLILYGDHPLIARQTLLDLTKTHRNNFADCTLLTAMMDNPQNYGRIIRDRQGRVTKIVEEKDCLDQQRQIKEINTGVYCFKKDVLFSNIDKIKINKLKKEYYLTDIIELLSNNGYKIEAVRLEDSSESYGINTREDLAKVIDIMRHRILRDFMNEGVTILDPNTTYIYPGVKIGQDTDIYPYTFIESGVVIGKRCSIGPFCHIRPKTILENDTSIGNFTELNRSRIGSFTKVRHFSYLGDARIGEKVNIGAGTVTANYDGRNKNITKIGSGAFIGSDTILVAPVEVGKNAITGAGSVVTRGKDVPDFAIVVGVPAKILERTTSQKRNNKLKTK